MQRKLLLILGYIAFTLILFAAMLVWKLPVDEIRQRLLVTVNERTPYSLEVASLAPSYFPPGVRLDQVRVADRRNAALSLELPSVFLSVPFMPLLAGRLEVATSTDMYGGEISVSASADDLENPSDMDMRLVVDDIDLQAVDQLKNMFQVQVQGSVSADLAITGDPANPRTMHAQGELDARKVAVSNIKSPNLKVDTLLLGRMEGLIGLRDGTLIIREGRLLSEHLDATVEGSLTPNTPLADSALDLSGGVRVNPEIVNLERIGVPMIVQMIRQGRELPLRLRGTLANPQLGI